MQAAYDRNTMVRSLHTIVVKFWLSKNVKFYRNGRVSSGQFIRYSVSAEIQQFKALMQYP